MLILMVILSKINNFILKYWRQLLLVGLGALLMFKAQGCYHKIFPPKTPISGPSSTTTVPTLPKNDKEQIIVKNNQVQIITPTGTTTVNGSRGVTVDVRKDGTIKVTPKTHGFVLNPMLGAGVNYTGPKAIIGAEFYYYKKLDLLGGLGVDKYLNHTAVFAACGYTPENKFFHNTSFWIGPMIDIKGIKGAIAGFAVRI